MKNYQPRLKTQYNKEILQNLKKDFGIENVMALPKLEKISVNIGLGKAKDDKAILEQAIEDIAAITGQKPVVTKASKAISNFKVRKGDPVGLKVTLRGERMWEFYDRLVNIVLPRLKDFRGVSLKAFDSNGNYSIGLSEHTVFPEIDTNKVTKSFGMQINIGIKNSDIEKSEKLLRYLGMPFFKSNK